MDKREKKWKEFKKTGRIHDYLRYCELKQENKDALQDKRDSFKAEKKS